MDIQKMKEVHIDYTGLEKFVDAQASDGLGLDAHSGFWLHGKYPYELIFNVDGDEYYVKDLGKEKDILPREERKKFKDIDMKEFFESTPGCTLGIVYTNKGSGNICIEIPEGEKFDPKKAAVVARKFIYGEDYSETVMRAFAYDGRIYECDPEFTTGKYSEVVWRAPKPDAVKLSKPTEEMEKMTIDDLMSFPFLVYRTSQIGSYCEPDSNPPYMPASAFYNKEGVIVVEASYNKYEYYTKIGEMERLVRAINSDTYHAGFNHVELDVYVTEGFILLNAPDREVTDHELAETVQTVWDKSRDYAEASPAFEKLVIRHIVHNRFDPYDYEPDEIDDDERIEIYDYLLIGKKLYKLNAGALDAMLSRPTQPNLFDPVLSAEEYAHNAREKEQYEKFLAFEASETSI